MDEVVDDQARYRERDVRDPAPKVLAVARLLRRGGRSPRRAWSPPRCDICRPPPGRVRPLRESLQQRDPIRVAREPRGGD
jgi:hypothetical protein